MREACQRSDMEFWARRVYTTSRGMAVYAMWQVYQYHYLAVQFVRCNVAKVELHNM